MAKRKKKRDLNRFRLLAAAIVAVLFFVSILGYYLYKLGFSSGYEAADRKNAIVLQKIRDKERESLRKLLAQKQSQPSEILDLNVSQKVAREKNVTKPKPKPKPTIAKQHKTKPKKVVLTGKKPKLAIIIDDVAFGYQVRAIQNLRMPINISFFPANKRHPNTPRYAKRLRHYMIHLPMEAVHYPRPEPNTLLTTSSDAFLERVIAKIRRDFPRARFVNNHTGSKFTADYEAMLRLVPILQKYRFHFVDSRTTSDTKVKEALALYGEPYIHRDIFLDNKQDVDYIKKQLEKAVRIAKRRGFAIAIGHPHPATIKAIAQSQGILKEVRLIYLDELRFRSR